jgi:hypothetical protein
LDGVREAVKASTEKGHSCLLVLHDVSAALKDANMKRTLRDKI